MSQNNQTSNKITIGGIYEHITTGVQCQVTDIRKTVHTAEIGETPKVTENVEYERFTSVDGKTGFYKPKHVFETMYRRIDIEL